MNIQDKIDELFDELDVYYKMIYAIPGDDLEDGYIVLLAEPDNETKEILKKLEFQQVKSDLFILDFKSFFEIPENEIEKIKKRYLDKFNADINSREYKNRMQSIVALWENIAMKYSKINTNFFRKFGMFYFEPSDSIISDVFKVSIFLARNENDLGLFATLLYRIGIESVGGNAQKRFQEFHYRVRRNEFKSKKEADAHLNKVFKSNIFSSQIKILRSYYIHINFDDDNNPTREKKENKLKQCLNVLDIEQLYNQYDYYLLEKAILKNFDGFLDLIFSTFKLKE